jgi:hypothetical protein
LSELYKRSLYRNKDYDFIFGSDIVEYDIRSAGLSLIKYYDLLPQKTIDFLEGMEKDARNKQIGMIQRDDPVFKERLKESFVNIRKVFFETNDIQDNEILAIKKDAIFTLDRHMSQRAFGPVEFVRKNTYTSYLYLNNYEMYINSMLRKIDIKGLSDYEEHRAYMLDFLISFCAVNEGAPSKKLPISRLLTFIDKYRHKDLPAGYYRRLSQENNFIIFDEINEEWVEVNDIDTSKYDVDISYNYINYLVPLAGIYI